MRGVMDFHVALDLAFIQIRQFTRTRWFSRRVLSWRLSITMEAAFCVAALEDALARSERSDTMHSKPILQAC